MALTGVSAPSSPIDGDFVTVGSDLVCSHDQIRSRRFPSSAFRDCLTQPLAAAAELKFAIWSIDLIDLAKPSLSKEFVEYSPGCSFVLLDWGARRGLALHLSRLLLCQG